jgi:CO/xanthine dehydrogenase FAD-binding subunit
VSALDTTAAARVPAPVNLEELTAALQEQPTAQLVGGGTLAVPARQRLRRPRPAILLGGVSELRRLEPQLCGAAVVLARVVDDHRLPSALRAAAASIGGPAVRELATVGGNIVASSPGCVAAVLTALGAEVALLGADRAINWSPIESRLGAEGTPVVAVRWRPDRRAAFAKVTVGASGATTATVSVGSSADGGDWVVALGATGRVLRRVAGVENELSDARAEIGRPRLQRRLEEHGLDRSSAGIAATAIRQCLSQFGMGG